MKNELVFLILVMEYYGMDLGMILCDYFVVKVMQGIISSDCNYGVFGDLVSDVYCIVDVMLEVCEQQLIVNFLSQLLGVILYCIIEDDLIVLIIGNFLLCFCCQQLGWYFFCLEEI